MQSSAIACEQHGLAKTLTSPSTIGHATTGAAPIEVDLLRAFLAGRDTPCPACGYNLRDLSALCCPECSTGIELQVRRDDAFKRPALAARAVLWLTLLVSLGSTLMMVWFMIISAWRMPWPYWGSLGISTLSRVACIAGLVSISRRRGNGAEAHRLAVSFTLWLLVVLTAFRLGVVVFQALPI